MIVTCPRCSSRYRIRDDKVKGRGAKISCPKCEHKFIVQRDPEPVAAMAGAGDARGVPVTFARGGQPIRREVAEEDDEADVPTTVMPHGSQMAQQLRAAAEAAQGGPSARVQSSHERPAVADRQKTYEAAVARNARPAARVHVDADEGIARSSGTASRSDVGGSARGRGLVVAGLMLVAAMIVAAVIGLGVM